jgi:hypothetical protein
MLSSICKLDIDVIDLSSGGRRYGRDTFQREPWAFIEMAMHFMRTNQESVIKGQRIRAAREHGRKEARNNGCLVTSVLPMWLKAANGPSNSRNRQEGRD